MQAFDETRLPAAIESARLEEALDLVVAALAAFPRCEEQLMSDIHGDAAAFDHLVRSAAGVTRELVESALSAGFSQPEVDAVCTLLYYPELVGTPGWPAALPAEHRGEPLSVLAARVRRHCGGAFHLVGDIWDRGAHGDDVVDVLAAIPEADVQWGNHDVCWMGAAAGDPVCIATLLFNNVKYMNVEQFEQGYGISLQPLFGLGARYYLDDGFMTPCRKAIAAILFKLEGQAVLRHPEWHMEERLLWDKMDLEAGEVLLGGRCYPLRTVDFPTFDPEHPFALNADEARVMGNLIAAFTSSERLRSHVQWLYDHGSVYGVSGDLLMFHGCVPLTEDGKFAEVECADGVWRSGRELLDWVDMLCRRAWETRDQMDLDWMGYLWCGWQSTFAGRVVKTFERAYLDDKQTHVEPEDPYYDLTRDDPGPCRMVLAEFGVDPDRGRLINGHTPVKLPKGESPVRGAGRRVVIDGGLCSAYRKTTGIAGYTLVRRGDDFSLVAHGEFPGEAAVFEGGADSPHEVAAL